jgi:hypothetical protein
MVVLLCKIQHCYEHCLRPGNAAAITPYGSDRHQLEQTLEWMAFGEIIIE